MPGLAMLAETLDSPLVCNLCTYKCQEVERLEYHLCTHHFHHYPFQCETCKIEGNLVNFPTLAAVKKHYLHAHRQRKFYFRTKVSPEVEEVRREVQNCLEKCIGEKLVVDNRLRLSICNVALVSIPGSIHNAELAINKQTCLLNSKEKIEVIELDKEDVNTSDTPFPSSSRLNVNSIFASSEAPHKNNVAHHTQTDVASSLGSSSMKEIETIQLLRQPNPPPHFNPPPFSSSEEEYTQEELSSCNNNSNNQTKQIALTNIPGSVPESLDLRMFFPMEEEPKQVELIRSNEQGKSSFSSLDTTLLPVDDASISLQCSQEKIIVAQLEIASTLANDSESSVKIMQIDALKDRKGKRANGKDRNLAKKRVSMAVDQKIAYDLRQNKSFTGNKDENNGPMEEKKRNENNKVVCVACKALVPNDRDQMCHHINTKHLKIALYTCKGCSKKFYGRRNDLRVVRHLIDEHEGKYSLLVDNQKSEWQAIEDRLDEFFGYQK